MKALLRVVRGWRRVQRADRPARIIRAVGPPGKGPALGRLGRTAWWVMRTQAGQVNEPVTDEHARQAGPQTSRNAQLLMPVLQGSRRAARAQPSPRARGHRAHAHRLAAQHRARHATGQRGQHQPRIGQRQFVLATPRQRCRLHGQRGRCVVPVHPQPVAIAAQHRPGTDDLAVSGFRGQQLLVQFGKHRVTGHAHPRLREPGPQHQPLAGTPQGHQRLAMQRRRAARCAQQGDQRRGLGGQPRRGHRSRGRQVLARDFIEHLLRIARQRGGTHQVVARARHGGFQRRHHGQAQAVARAA